MSDELSRALGRFVRKVTRWLPFTRVFPARVMAQAANAGALDVLPDDTEIRGTGFQGIQIRHGLPGWKAKVPVGTKVRLCFDAADPSRPFAALWDEGAVTELAFDGGTKAVARVDDTLHAGSVLIVQNASSLAITAVTYFPGTGAGGTAASAALAAALGAGNIAFLATLNDGRITSGNSKLLA